MTRPGNPDRAHASVFRASIASIGRLLCTAFACATISAAGTLVPTATSAEVVDLRAYSLAIPADWREIGDETALSEAYAKLAEPILASLIATPPPVLLSVRAARAAAPENGTAQLFASWVLISGDAEEAVVDLREQRDLETWSAAGSLPVQRIDSLMAIHVAGRPATRFTLALADGRIVDGAAFSLADRPDALAMIAIVGDQDDRKEIARSLDATIESIVLGDREEHRRREASEREEAGSLRSYLREQIWESEGASEGFLFFRRIALMAVLFCLFFGAQLQLLMIAAKKRAGTSEGDDETPEFRSEKFILPIAFLSITLTALIVSWLVQA